MSEIIRVKDKLYVYERREQFGVPEELKAQEAEAAAFRWHGKKIPICLVQQIHSFHEWSYQEFQSEALVHLMYSESAGWSALVFPQVARYSMSVELLDNHPDRTKAFQLLRDQILATGLDDSAPRTLCGTSHHHCKGAAFQSSVDNSDEKKNAGLHWTVGYIGNDSEPKYSLHFRASYRGNMTAIHLSDWFETPSEEHLPKELRDAWLQIVLARKCQAQDPFPDWWKEMIVKRQDAHPWQKGSCYSGASRDNGHSQMGFHPGYGHGHGHDHSPWHPSHEDWRSRHHSLGAHGSASENKPLVTYHPPATPPPATQSTPAQEKRVITNMTWEESFIHDMKETLQLHGKDWTDAQLDLAQIVNDEFLHDVVHAMVQNYTYPTDAMDIAEKEEILAAQEPATSLKGDAYEGENLDTLDDATLLDDVEEIKEDKQDKKEDDGLAWPDGYPVD